MAQKMVSVALQGSSHAPFEVLITRTLKSTKQYVLFFALLLNLEVRDPFQQIELDELYTHWAIPSLGRLAEAATSRSRVSTLYLL